MADVCIAVLELNQRVSRRGLLPGPRTLNLHFNMGESQKTIEDWSRMDWQACSVDEVLKEVNVSREALMSEKADELDCINVLVSDRIPSLGVAGGLSREEWIDRAEEFEETKVTGDGFDVPVDRLEECDGVVAALHDRVEDATDRFEEVFQSYPVNVLPHPTNSLIREKNQLDLDFDHLIEAAGGEDVAVEINSQPSPPGPGLAAREEY